MPPWFPLLESRALDKQALALFSTLTVALLHTAIPSHWLCFVAVGRAQGWKRRQVLAVAAFAGTVHVLTTVALGAATRVVGSQFLDEEAFERLSAGILIVLGLVYLVLHFLRAGHHHAEENRRVPDRWAVIGLVLSVTISPCTAAIPILVAAAGRGVGGFLLVSGVLLVATVGNMLLLVLLTSLGVEKLQFRLFDRYEKLILGVLLLGLGGAILAVGHGH